VVCGGHSIQEVFVDTYIIRISRREESDPHMVVGTVEEPGIPGRKAFVNLDQLWDILNLKKKKLSKLKKKIEVHSKGGGNERIHGGDA
jgi:hypothetical protein